jgi:hypothetical protein
MVFSSGFEKNASLFGFTCCIIFPKIIKLVSTSDSVHVLLCWLARRCRSVIKSGIFEEIYETDRTFVNGKEV